jgi:hypothetical protein
VVSAGTHLVGRDLVILSEKVAVVFIFVAFTASEVHLQSSDISAKRSTLGPLPSGRTKTHNAGSAPVWRWGYVQ